MYESTPDLTCLRQGDVIRDFYFPRYSLAEARFLHSIDGATGAFSFDNQALLGTKCGYAVVLSQCCEFNEGKRNSFSLGLLVRLREVLRPRLCVAGVNLAQLVPFEKSPFRQHALEAIRRANCLDPNAGRTDAVNVYLLEADGQHLLEPHIVDFTQVISVRMKDVGRILSKKALQLTHKCRREFQHKLAYFYGRSAT
jgi:hypothetical protein